MQYDECQTLLKNSKIISNKNLISIEVKAVWTVMSGDTLCACGILDNLVMNRPWLYFVHLSTGYNILFNLMWSV